jgi:hypothetical protein
MRKLLWLLLSGLVVSVGYVYASVIPSAFVVEVNPSTFDVNEAVDVTIRAIDANGSTIVDYDWFVFVDLISDTPGVSLAYDDFVLPGEWFIPFYPGDLWVKTLSKSLIVRKNGSYVFRAYDWDDDRVAGQRSVVVGSQQQNAATTITITTPSAWWIETASAITVLADAGGLSNSPYQLLLNGLLSLTGTTNAQWSINAIVTGLQEGSNTLQIRMLDLNGIVLWQSAVVTFMYQSIADEFFYGIQILPSTQTKQWDKLVFNVSTSDAVSTVELILGTGRTYPMDRDTAGKHLKQVLIEDKGIVPVSVRLTAGGNMQLYQDVASLTVQESIAIWLTRFYTPSVDRSVLMMTWQVIGQAPSFIVRYGTNKDALTQELTVSTNEIEITNIVPTNVYYFQIIPADANGNVIGTPSEIKEIDPSSLQAQVTCIVDGIVLRNEEIEGKYYFIWDAVENAKKYIIYRSETPTTILSEMRKVSETTSTRFEYPFNKNALQEEFAYYAVVAVCADGKEIQIDQVKKVEVWPYDTILLALLASILFYSVWSLYRRSI